MLLEPMVARLKAQRDLPTILGTACWDSVALHGGEFGNVQLVDDDGNLRLVHGDGFSRAFVAATACLGSDAGTVCARALSARKTIHIPDVAKDPEFRPYLPVAVETGFQSVISSPLISSGGEVLGVMSTHFANPKVPTGIELLTRESYCRALADHLLSKWSAEELAVAARQLSHALVQRSAPEGGVERGGPVRVS